ncbi:MAG: hypothetical protein DI623_12600 [Sphingomonas sanxanigenens]|uniref:(2Fe-2S) ferredoxin domain-containing protein n=1 Tax=Sphingomonas sanxanigenens TaxID=397260 RepID=A0A2W5A5I2_9SPHN|nr:MAG: hypothetical protein DI623_12600 [Sphingomonas sanxanigenens]
MKSSVRSNWQAALLVCGKCSKKLGGGFGPKGKTSLAKALKKETGGGKGRKARVGVIETKCLGVCPKHAVTMVDTRRGRDWILVREGADVGDLVRELGLADEG